MNTMKTARLAEVCESTAEGRRAGRGGAGARAATAAGATTHTTTATTMAAAAAPLSVAVAGAGPSGLAFAGSLLREARAEGLEVSVAVVERWQRHRDQGSGWDVRGPRSPAPPDP